VTAGVPAEPAIGPLAELRAALAAHTPGDERERMSLRRTRSLLDWLPAPLDETADPTHVTGSAIVLDHDGRVLLHRHKRVGIWLQPGGHVDPGETVAEAALRETAEESGLTASHPSDGGPTVIHVDVHEGPRGHVHLDVRYLLYAAADAPLRPSPGESPDVGWFTPEQATELGDVSLVAALDAALTRWRGGPRSPR
jgi:8-oxo-dGTP pyrophosphatase MutT (NUDIX family)